MHCIFLKVMWSVTTPFDEYRIGKWELNYSLRQDMLRADTKFDYNGKVTAVNFNGKADFPRLSAVDVTVNVNTPFRGRLKKYCILLLHQLLAKISRNTIRTYLQKDKNMEKRKKNQDI